MARGLKYSEFAPRIDMERFYEAIDYEPVSTTRSGDDLGFCPDPWGLHTHGDQTGKFAIHPEKRLYNCVSQDTHVQTDEGLRRAGNLVGREVNVLTEGGAYRPARWYSYGVQRLYEVVLANGDRLYATEGHEWVISRSGADRWRKPERVTTLDLLGERIPFQPGPQHELDDAEWRAGVRHGLIFGDGTAQGEYCRIDQFGDENCELLDRFFENVRDIPYDGMRHAQVTAGLKGPYKARPPLSKSQSYLRGFLAGLIAADGHVAKNGTCVIHQANLELLKGIRWIASACGVPTYEIKKEREKNPWTGEDAPIYKLTLSKTAVREQTEALLLKTSHRANLEASGPTRNAVSVEVVAVNDTGRDEEVVCCVEPETHTMVIEHGYLTGQCWVCGGGTLLSLVMAMKDMDDEEATEWLYQFAVETEQDDDAFLVELDDILRVVEREKVVLPVFNVHVLDKWGPDGDFWTQDMFAWFERRGIADEVINDYRLGYGIVTKRAPRKADGKAIDVDYTGPAIVFPHFWQGKLVGWQNRWLADDRPKWCAKYTNTMEFPKNYTIFNFDRAARRPDPPVVVESVPTVLWLESCGVSAVATFGSSVTDEQLRVLRRFQQGVILGPDNDGAGRKWEGLCQRYLERYVPVYTLPPVDQENGDLGDLAPDQDALFAHLDRWQ